MQRILTLFLILLVGTLTYAQRMPNKAYVHGTVMGYHYEPKGFFKKEQVEIQGSLSGATVQATNSKGKKIGSDKTGDGGTFGLYLPLGDKYNLTFSKSGYGTSAVEIDLSDTKDEKFKTNGLLLKNLEFILNDNESGKAIDDGRVFASIVFKSANEAFSINPIYFDKKDRLFKEPENSTPHNLLISSVEENKSINKGLRVKDGNTALDENIEENETVDSGSDHSAHGTHNSTNFKPSLGEILNWKNLTSTDLDNRAKDIEDAWEQLEKDKLVAVTEEDFLWIKAREEMLVAAERELEAARAYIEEQDNKIRAQRYFMFTLIALFLLLGGFAFYLVRSIKQKNQLNEALADRNKRITSSINYAERIQKSVLLREEQIKALLPNSFVFYKPLDVVSGDFYWFSEINGKIIMAAVDCTGHGVPGAFMSLIGNTLMNQIIKEKKITEPAKILENLHQGIVDALQQTADIRSSQDGMDMTVCSYDKTSGSITFAGAVNPMFVVENGEFKEISGNLRGIGGILRPHKQEQVTFDQQTFKFEKGTNIYLFSDGYMDQFGGANDQKFNLPRFRELLLDIQDEPMERQKELMEERLDKWKGNGPQIDDILVIGLKV